MNRTQQLTPGAALLIGLLFVAAGILPMLAAFDSGPLSAQDINGPPWLGFAAGGSFAAAGLAIMAGPQAPLATRLFGTLALAGLAGLAGLAAVGNWIAFGAGSVPARAAFPCPGCGAQAIFPGWPAAPPSDWAR